MHTIPSMARFHEPHEWPENCQGVSRVWYPAVRNCPGFVCVGKRGVARFMTIARACNKNASQTNTKYGRQEKCF